MCKNINCKSKINKQSQDNNIITLQESIINLVKQSTERELKLIFNLITEIKKK